jgi:hypothetical protein
VIAQFLAGVIVGVLIGLALAPLLRSWILWQMTKPWREKDAPSVFEPTAASRSER